MTMDEDFDESDVEKKRVRKPEEKEFPLFRRLGVRGADAVAPMDASREWGELLATEYDPPLKRPSP